MSEHTCPRCNALISRANGAITGKCDRCGWAGFFDEPPSERDRGKGDHHVLPQPRETMTATVRALGGFVRRAWWNVHSRWQGKRIARPKIHVCWWGADLGPWRGYYIVLNWHAYQGPRLYASPNATPWHHDARNLFTFRRMSSYCSCDGCEMLRAITEPAGSPRNSEG